jgi:NAD(P)-dependent dehydrogenase (short-subunit alcohol dehydrogenase family)
MAQVRRMVEEFKQKHQRLDVLVNNAGMLFSKRRESVDGYEMTLALNHLSHFLLTNLLMDRLIASAPSRVVNVSSAAHLAARIDFEDIQNHHYEMMGFGAYGRSKLANVMFTYELARRLEGSGVTTNALHPGTVNTGFNRNNSAGMRLAMAIAAPFLLTPEEGAQTQIYLASAPDVEDVTGKYFVRRQPTRSSPVSYEVEAQKKLWRVSEELTGIKSVAGD